MNFKKNKVNTKNIITIRGEENEKIIVYNSKFKTRGDISK